MGAHELAVVGLAGSGLGTALSLPMLWRPARRPVEARLLGAAVILTSAIGALISARLAGLVPVWASVEHGINILGFVAFPTFVLYTWHATAAPITPRRVAWLAIPELAYIVLVLSRWAMGLSTRVPFAWLLPGALGFTVVCVVTLWRRREQRGAGLVPAAWVVAFVAIVNVAQIARMEIGHLAPVRALIPLVLSAGFLGIAAYGVWRTFANTPASPTSRTPRYGRSGLNPSNTADLLARLDHVLTHERVFTRPDFTLRHLAEALSTTPQQVSELLNRHTGVSFNEMLNRRRVEEVKAQLLDPANDRYTVEGIGASAGFASRSALYAAFKRLEGTTPAAFRASRPQLPQS